VLAASSFAKGTMGATVMVTVVVTSLPCESVTW
jgi:hypothetical protein